MWSITDVLRQRLKRKARTTRFGVGGLGMESADAALKDRLILWGMPKIINKLWKFKRLVPGRPPFGKEAVFG